MNTIAIIGCGNMGLIYAHAFLEGKITGRDQLLLVEKNEERRKMLAGMNVGRVVTVDHEEIAACNIIILAVKPQDFRALAPALKRVIRKDSVILSIMAGTEIAFIAAELEQKQIVRAMPNLPVSIGLGMTAFAASPELSQAQIMQVENLLSTTGKTIYLQDEQQLNAVTALSGSGPAYFFYFMKSLIDAGIRMGLDEYVASILARQTMVGSFHLLNDGQKSLDEYIASVASKGGTTEAALKVFEERDLHGTVVEALCKAEKRAKELSIK